ncbi:MAG: hypothetical protein LBN07_01730 [Christensenellaceae bacterium]|jgi:stage IV sporulation protein FB|nr:hypothetical protein [Christensenellaceae bacterium]
MGKTSIGAPEQVRKNFSHPQIKISLDLSFLLFALLLIYLGSFILLLNYIAVLFLHEYAHAYAAKRLGYSAGHIKVSAFGVRLNMNNSVMRHSDEIKIALAGPLMNIILVVICLALWWVFPVTYHFTNLFCLCSLITAAVNLIPAHPLDGGRAISCLLSRFAGPRPAGIICAVLNIVISLGLFAVFFVTLKYGLNLTYLFMGAFILVSSINKNPGRGFDFLRYKNLKQKSGTKVKTIIISSDMPLFKVLGFVVAGSFLHLLIMHNGALLGELYESDLEKVCSGYSPNIAIGEVDFRNFGVKGPK